MALDIPALARTVDVAGQPITYYDSQDGRGSTETILLVHGTGGSAPTHFAWILPMLATRQRVVALSMACPGPVAQGERALELDDLSNQVIAVREALDVSGPVTMLGFSLGSPTVTHTAIRRPELVDRMIHLNGFVSTDRQRRMRAELWRHLYRTDQDALRRFNFFCAFSAGWINGQDPTLVDQMLANQTFDDFTDAQMELNMRIDITTEASTLSQPSLVIGSQDDIMVPLRSQKQMFGVLRESRLAVIGGGHASVTERPAQVTRLVQDFLDDPTRHPAGSHVPAVLN